MADAAARTGDVAIISWNHVKVELRDSREDRGREVKRKRRTFRSGTRCAAGTGG